jgi:flagellar biogenesis protein FliO
MSVQGFVMIEAVGAALLALWLVVRFPNSGPTSMRGAVVQVGASVLLGWALAPLTAIVVGSGVPAAAFLAALLVVLPALIYIFLAWAWMVKVLQGALGQSHR